MGTLKNCDVRKIEDFPNAIWLEKPTDYPYVRESEYCCCAPNFKPLKKRDKWKLIGYTKPKYMGNRIYKGTYWWLKDYDLGMPNEKTGYGKDKRNFNKINTPSEAVRFIEKKEVRNSSHA